ncbi:MAG: Trm112 family protein [Myxococcales bacterium]|nr:Trm112 family protein [Myxococcales bacterium]
MLDQALLDILACPLGKAGLKVEGEELVCERCGPRFPIRDGIPVLLIEDATLPEGITEPEQLECQRARRPAGP